MHIYNKHNGISLSGKICITNYVSSQKAIKHLCLVMQENI